MSPDRGRRWSGAGLVVGLWVGFVVVAAADPVTLRSWCAKEGPVEWLSAAVLIAAAAVWVRRIARDRRASGRVQPWAVVMSVFAVLVLVEELDYGALLGAHALAGALQDAVGHRNLHNFAGGHGYVLFGLVPAAAVIVGATRPRRVGAAPSHAESVTLVVAALPSVLSVVAWEAWADALDEFAELALYVGVLAWAVAARGLAGAPESAAST